MKRQTGVWVDVQVWDAYRELCKRERLGLAEPIEGYLRFVVKNGSPSAVLSLMQSFSDEKSGRFEDYVRVLLDWYKNGQYWTQVTDENPVSVEHLLLDALKELPDEQLRKEVREALVYKPRGRKKKATEEPKAEKEAVELEDSFDPSGQTCTVTERIDRVKSQLAGRTLDPEQARRMLEKIHEIRQKLRDDGKERRKK